ncbi:peptidylprolyl isomerase [Aliikangiella coralliicola]|uniref:peptidylprolyl isomerase n=1 Tax=Aliikangiella coralliicola TaxID=2592383 RepID=A0A545U763_9GAMM|nr:peptidylprolyl isomerase [Aliikangiella coralliicola]TQV85321.1 hypothetical protein FLL46_19335 [Aliikangiella coralliicola]
MRLSLLLIILSISLPSSPTLLATNLASDSGESSPINDNDSIIHQIYELVDQRNLNSAVFDQALQHSDSEIVRASLMGLGRIGGEGAADKALPFIEHKDEQLRRLAAFAIGQSAHKPAAEHLWPRLEKEKSTLVKKELYLSLGKLGEENLLNKMMQRLDRETSRESAAYLFQCLTIGATFHREQLKNYSEIDFSKVLNHFSEGDDFSALAGLFMTRVPEIESFITAEDLHPLTLKKMSPYATAILAKLIAKTTLKQHTLNRELLAWAIEQSESSDLGVQLESTRILGNLVQFPQALIQLGKLHISPNPVVAQTALKVLADSELNTKEVLQLFKKQLKSKTPSMVVEAISGMVKRQKKEEMSWIVNLFGHPSPYVKIRLLDMLKNKPDSNFDNLIKHFTKDPEQEVSRYAKRLLKADDASDESIAQSPSYTLAIKAARKKVTLKTTIGDIKIQLLADAPYTSWHFINNAKLGNFDNSYFSRVIGNFVAQGGDSIGDRSGSSDETIREEINFLAHEPMTVGMATAGKDTGTSQFFINTARNLHLDRSYTIFGKVIDGQDVAMKMTHGVKVLKVLVE